MDVCIYKELFTEIGYEVEVINTHTRPTHVRNTTSKADVQLFLERIEKLWLPFGWHNMFVINQEIHHDTSLYNQLGAIICKSKWAQLLVENYIALHEKQDGLSDLKVWYTGRFICCSSPENKITNSDLFLLLRPHFNGLMGPSDWKKELLSDCARRRKGRVHPNVHTLI